MGPLKFVLSSLMSFLSISRISHVDSSDIINVIVFSSLLDSQSHLMFDLFCKPISSSAQRTAVTGHKYPFSYAHTQPMLGTTVYRMLSFINGEDHIVIIIVIVIDIIFYVGGPKD